MSGYAIGALGPGPGIPGLDFDTNPRIFESVTTTNLPSVFVISHLIMTIRQHLLIIHIFLDPGKTKCFNYQQVPY